MSKASKLSKYHRDHTRTTTSIEQIQQRLSVIRSNLRQKNKPKSKETEESKNHIHSESESLYPSFLHSQSKTQANPQNMPSLSDLLQNDALGLKTLSQENEKHSKEEPNDIEIELRRKKKKHERALSMMPSLIQRSKTYDTAKPSPKFGKVALTDTRAHSGGHNRAMPSMPNFLSKLQRDKQLKNIISNVFTGNKGQMTPQRADVKTDAQRHDITSLQNKIQTLEAALGSYQQIIKDNTETVKVLKQTISRIEAQRDEANKKMEALNDEKEIQLLRDKNSELQAMAQALVINLTRKEQSLEEALHAMHSLNEARQEIHDQQTAEPVSISRKAKSYNGCEAEQNENGEHKRRASFTKGIARKLKSLSNSFTQIKNTETKPKQNV